MGRAQNSSIVPFSNRSQVVTIQHDGKIGDLGPGAVEGQVGSFAIQFNPDLAFIASGSFFTVMGVMMGKAADDLNMPFMPIPYRRVTVNNIASDYQLVPDPISTPSFILIPSSGMVIGLSVVCNAGSCNVSSWNMNGPAL